MTRVKICGLTRPEHVAAARDADALGFVVASPRSRRNLDVEDAARLIRLASPLQSTVLVTAATDAKLLAQLVRDARPHALQAPRTAHDAFAALRAEFPTLRLLAATRPEDAELAPAEADAYVLDATRPDGYGGTGEPVDWRLARAFRETSAKPVLLGGGLTPENVADAIRLVQPHGVDVSSGVETDGVKDAGKIRRFIDRARRATP